jgi:hypothetical protein
MNESSSDLATRALQLSERIRPILRGQGPEVQGAALAELLACWLAGHYRMGEEAMERLLASHVVWVREALPVWIEEVKRRMGE